MFTLFLHLVAMTYLYLAMVKIILGMGALVALVLTIIVPDAVDTCFEACNKPENVPASCV